MNIMSSLHSYRRDKAVKYIPVFLACRLAVAGGQKTKRLTHRTFLTNTP